MKECAVRLFGRIGARLKKGAVIGTGAVLIARFLYVQFDDL